MLKSFFTYSYIKKKNSPVSHLLLNDVQEDICNIRNRFDFEQKNLMHNLNFFNVYM